MNRRVRKREKKRGGVSLQGRKTKANKRTYTGSQTKEKEMETGVSKGNIIIASATRLFSGDN